MLPHNSFGSGVGQTEHVDSNYEDGGGRVGTYTEI
jgi:hypothetical protein